jgi:hypothetical protein
MGHGIDRCHDPSLSQRMDGLDNEREPALFGHFGVAGLWPS